MKRPRQPPATDRQKEFVQAVVELTEQTGQAPSAAAIAEHMHVHRLGARPQLLALEHKGYLEDIPKVVRSGQWRLTALGRKLLGELPESELGRMLVRDPPESEEE